MRAFTGANFVKVGAVFFAAAVGIGAQREAHVTQIIREVNVLEKKSDPRPAAINQRVGENEAVRTGDESRSELTFPDMTIERLGANSLFSFKNGGRNVQLNSGSILLRVPKDSGGADIRTSAVTVAVTGTTLILETGRGGRSKLTTLEGEARLSLAKYPRQSRRVRAGQMLDVPAGATTLPEPVDIDLNEVLRTHPLIVGFPQLPSYPLIVAAANSPQRQTVYQGRPVGPGGGGGVYIPPRTGRPPVVVNNPPTRGGGNNGGGNAGGGGGGGRVPVPTATPSTPTPTPPPQIGRRVPRQPGRTQRSTPPPVR